MKNILVILVTVGIGYAYWYQLPEPPPPAPAPAAPVVAVPAPTPVFTALHTALDEPATRTGNHQKQSSVLLGDDNARLNH